MRSNFLVSEWVSGLNTSSKATRLSLLVASALLGAWAIAASAQLRVDLMPYSPVPITAQSLVVLLIGWFYGRKLAVMTVLSYLAFGIFGVPVFASKATGMAWLMGATGGYLIGFLVAVFAIATLKPLVREKFKSSAIADVSVLLAGKILILGMGVLWLSRITGFSTAIATGLVPFLPGMIVKLVSAFAIIRAVEKRS